jgi:tetrahydromethanopterin S-methyltransferase subunit A
VNAIGEAIGELCKVILPINEEFYLGNSDSSIAICTLSSIDLLKNFANSEILNQISIVGRLLSENKGIDSIIKYVNKNPKVDTIIVCGKEVWGHKSGHSLFQLHKNGTDQNNRIINSTSPDPFLTVSKSEIKYFQDNVNLIDLINVTEFELILKKSRFFLISI